MKEKLAYRYFFSMSDEESHSESECYYPKDEEQAKTEQNNINKVITHEDENFGNSREKLQKFVQEQKSENTVKKTSSDIYVAFLPFSRQDKQDKCSDFGLTTGRT